MREPGRRRFRWTILGAMIAVAVAAVSFRLVVLARNAREKARTRQEIVALDAEREVLTAVVSRAAHSLIRSTESYARGEVSDAELADEQASFRKTRRELEQLDNRLRLLRRQFGAPAS